MKIPEYYRKIFNSWLIKLYDLLFKIEVHGKDKELRELITRKISSKSKRILDMATGTGSVAIEIKKTFPKTEVEGIDLSNEMLEIARKKAKKENIKITFTQQNIESTNFPAESFDDITISFALHEIPTKNRIKTIKEIHRLLKKDGKFIIMDLNYPKNTILKNMLLLHLTIFEPKYAKTILTQNFKEILKRHGFNNTKKYKYLKGIVQCITTRKR